MYLDKKLARRADVEVTLISRENFILFTPMLHEVAAGDDAHFARRRSLKRHGGSNSHARDATNFHDCPICARQFRSRSAIVK
jgi:NADH dehydrogenase FAD-containing subunit